jgi:peroxiredoxin Q/BCP
MIQSRQKDRTRRTVGVVLLLAVTCVSTALARMQPGRVQGATPKMNEKAPDFSLTSIDGMRVRLSDELKHGPIVLVVLRGWPGYQCPFCTRQFGDFLSHASELASQGARVVFVYPGPSDGIKGHAQAFTANRQMPPNFQFLVDPDYTFTFAYGLRWEAPEETAYPATFVLDPAGIVTFVHISKEHGDRVAAADTIKVLAAMRQTAPLTQPSRRDR